MAIKVNYDEPVDFRLPKPGMIWRVPNDDYLWRLRALPPPFRPKANIVDRSTFIGSSDIGALIGANKWKTPYALWAEKTGRIERDQTDNDAMYWGRLLEPVIAKAWGVKHNAHISQNNRRAEAPGIRGSAEVDYFIDPGFKAPGDDEKRRGPGVLEVKTANVRMRGAWGEEWTDEIPEEYYCQVIWQMGIHNLARERPQGGDALSYAVVAVLIGGQELRSYLVPYDTEVFGMLLAKTSQFWKLVEGGDEPPPEWNDLPVVRDVHRHAPTEKPLLATPELAKKHAMLAAYRKEIRDMERETDRLSAELIAAMGEHTELLDDTGASLMTYRPQSRTRVDYKGVMAAVRRKTKSKAVRRWIDVAITEHTSITTHRVMRVKQRENDDEQ